MLSLENVFGVATGAFGAMGCAIVAYDSMGEGRKTKAKVMGGLALAGAFVAISYVQDMSENKTSAPAAVTQKSGMAPSKPQDIPVPVKKGNPALSV